MDRTYIGRVLFAVAALLADSSACRGPATRGQSTTERVSYSPEFHVRSQATSRRVFKQWRLRKLWQVPEVSATALADLEAGPDGEIYALDRGTGCLARVDQAGAQTLCAESAGPQHLRLATAQFNVDDQSVLILGASNRLWKWIPGSAASQVRMIKDLTRFVIDRDRVIYFPLPPPNDNSAYRWFDPTDGASGIRNGSTPILTHETQHQFAVLGKIVADRSRHVVYHVSDRAGLLVLLSDSGQDVELLLARSTIDNTPLPELERRTVGEAIVTSMPYGQPVVAVGLAFDHGALWVLTLAPTGPKTFQHVVDLYDGQTGDYRYSYMLPFKSHGMAARSGVIYFIADDNVQAWRSQ
jgi:hypothetical protein